MFSPTCQDRQYIFHSSSTNKILLAIIFGSSIDCFFQVFLPLDIQVMPSNNSKHLNSAYHIPGTVLSILYSLTHQTPTTPRTPGGFTVTLAQKVTRVLTRKGTPGLGRHAESFEPVCLQYRTGNIPHRGSSASKVARCVYFPIAFSAVKSK